MVANSAVTRHAFFHRIREDTPEAKTLIREFAKADYLVAKGFAQFLAHLVSLIDNARVRVLLVGNLWDEHGSGDADEIHFELYKRLLGSLGVTEPTLPEGARADFLQLHYDIANKSVLDGIAVFTYANEFLSMYEFSQIRSACKKHFPSVDERYFETNQKADVVHTSQLEAALETLVTTSDELQSVTFAVERALTERARFYDLLLAESAA
jgi:pyrroloquinoline quinone (PQQ) biosynthesis protein C